MRCRYHLKKPSQCGAGLIEVAISLLLLAIGTLGLGTLQISAKRMGYEAIQRGEAAALASDLLERARANRGALPAYGTVGLGSGAGVQTPAPAADCSAGSCSAAEIKAWDLWQWAQALDGASTSDQAGGLLRPTACVTVSGRHVSVEIAWQGYRSLAPPPHEQHCGSGNYGARDADRQWLQMSSWIGEE